MELFVPGAAAAREVPPPGAPVPAPASAAAAAAAPPASAPGARTDEDEEEGAGGGGPALPGEAAGATAIAPRPPSHGDRGGGAARRLSWPVQGVLYSRFGVRQGQRHDGIDIAAPEGTPIGAAAEGQVVYAGSQSGYGSIVIVRHEAGLLTLYAHASAVLVRQGERVAAGQPIARVGRSGRTSGPHLHFEVREGTRPRNPLVYLP
jgi:murein DD-endopeptidase MepM/ murein hydrolase activator NlpD